MYNQYQLQVPQTVTFGIRIGFGNGGEACLAILREVELLKGDREFREENETSSSQLSIGRHFPSLCILKQ